MLVDASAVFVTLPWRGRVGEVSSETRYEPGWGEHLPAIAPNLHPTPLAALATLPLQGRVNTACGGDGVL